jgi:hypothetical protein
MAKVDSFLDSLVTYDKENIHPEVIKAIQPYLKDSEFDPEFVRTKSGAAAGKNFKHNFILLPVHVMQGTHNNEAFPLIAFS